MVDTLQPRIWTGRELLAQSFPQDPWLIYPLVKAGGEWMLSGEPDSYKSLFLTQLLIYASEGIDYNGYQVERPLKVLYINMDDSEQMTQDRFRKLNTTPDVMGDGFMIVCQPSLQFNHAGIEVMTRWINERDPDLVVFDHLTQMIPGGTVNKEGVQQYILFKSWILRQHKGVIAMNHLNRETKELLEMEKKRRIAGVQDILATHGVQTLNEKGSSTIVGGGPVFYLTMVRNKYLAHHGEGEYNKKFSVEVRDKGSLFEKTWIREVK